MLPFGNITLFTFQKSSRPSAAWPCKNRRLRIAAANGATTPPAGLVRRLDIRCPRNCHAGYYIYTTSSCQEKNGLIMKMLGRINGLCGMVIRAIRAQGAPAMDCGGNDAAFSWYAG
jgi:hypothetical protein